MLLTDHESCPCGNGTAYARCCKPLHDEGVGGLGTTAEQTMRARYCAYVARNEPFLLATWHPSTRPASIDFSDDIEWHGLTIVERTAGGGLDSTGTVEFRARFQRGDARLELHELSEFTRASGVWFYVKGHNPD